MQCDSRRTVYIYLKLYVSTTVCRVTTILVSQLAVLSIRELGTRHVRIAGGAYLFILCLSTVPFYFVMVFYTARSDRRDAHDELYVLHSTEYLQE